MNSEQAPCSFSISIESPTWASPHSRFHTHRWTRGLPRQRAYPVGALVEYHSASQGGWIPAKATPNAPSRESTAFTADKSLWTWLLSLSDQASSPVDQLGAAPSGTAQVTGHAPDGKYDLDCKPGVPPRHRRPAGSRPFI